MNIWQADQHTHGDTDTVAIVWNLYFIVDFKLCRMANHIFSPIFNVRINRFQFIYGHAETQVVTVNMSPLSTPTPFSLQFIERNVVPVECTSSDSNKPHAQQSTIYYCFKISRLFSGVHMYEVSVQWPRLHNNWRLVSSISMRFTCTGINTRYA